MTRLLVGVGRPFPKEICVYYLVYWLPQSLFLGLLLGDIPKRGRFLVEPVGQTDKERLVALGYPSTASIVSIL